MFGMKASSTSLRRLDFTRGKAQSLSSERRIISDVPRDSILGPILLGFRQRVLMVPGVRLSLFTDDMAEFTADANVTFAAQKF